MTEPIQRSILAVYGSARGIGYVLFESPLSIIDWGVKVSVGERKNIDCTNAVAKLIDLYVPDVLVLDDTSKDRERRTKRIRALYRMLEGVAIANGVDVERISKEAVRACFEKLGARTKYERAAVMANLLPALFPGLPNERKLWQSVNPKMDMFEAAGLGWAAYSGEF